MGLFMEILCFEPMEPSPGAPPRYLGAFHGVLRGASSAAGGLRGEVQQRGTFVARVGQGAAQSGERMGLLGMDSFFLKGSWKENFVAGLFGLIVLNIKTSQNHPPTACGVSTFEAKGSSNLRAICSPTSRRDWQKCASPVRLWRFFQGVYSAVVLFVERSVECCNSVVSKPTNPLGNH